MQQISDFSGNLFSHVAAVYRPGERDLAVEFVEALGCVAMDTAGMADSGSPFISVHPDPDDRDPINNVFYLSEMMPQQLALEKALKDETDTNPKLREMVAAFGRTALASPASTPHFALNFPSMEAIEPILERLATGLKTEIADRVSVTVLRPGEPGAMGKDCIIAFVHTDIIVSGIGGFGQIIELQGRPRKFLRQ